MKSITREGGKENYVHYETKILLDAFTKGPERIRNAIEGLTEEELKSRLIENKWTIAEILIHLADAEIIGACRFRMIICGQKENLPVYNQAQWAIDMDYKQNAMNEIKEHLELFKKLRSTTSLLLNEIKDSGWRKTGYHPERGMITLRDILEIYADHSERHLKQILLRRKYLNKELEIRPIL